MDPVACLCSNVRRAAQALTAVYDAALARHGLKVTQFSLLRAVARHDGPNLTELAEATGLDRSTLGRNLRVLEAQGLVIFGSAADARDCRVILSAAGRAKVAAVAPDWERVQASLSRALGADAERLVAISRRVTEVARAGGRS